MCRDQTCKRSTPIDYETGLRPWRAAISVYRCCKRPGVEVSDSTAEVDVKIFVVSRHLYERKRTGYLRINFASITVNFTLKSRRVSIPTTKHDRLMIMRGAVLSQSQFY